MPSSGRLSGLVRGVLRHPRRGRHGVLRSPLLNVILVRQRLLGIHRHIRHVGGGHVRVLGHARPVGLGREVLVWRLFGRIDLVRIVDTVLVPLTWLRRVQAGL